MPLNFLNNGYFAGTVGIGTNSPSSQLTVHKNALTPAVIELSNAVVSGDNDVVVAQIKANTVSEELTRIETRNSTASHDNGNLLFYNRNGSTNTLAESMRIAGDGNVGIGVTNPILKLHIKGTNSLPATSGTAQNGGIRIENGVNNGVLDIGASNATGAPGWLQATDKADLSQAYKLLLNPNGGNVGIGTTSPVATFQVGSITATAMSQVVGKARIVGTNYIPSSTQMGTLDIASTTRNSSAPFNQGFGPSLTFSQSISGYVNGYEVVLGAIKTISTQTGNTGQEAAMTFLVNGGTATGVVERMRIAEDGNVGIGTDDPGESLEILKDGGAIIKLHDPGNNSWKIKADSNFHIYDDSSSDYLTILNSGDVGIGTTTPVTKLEIKGVATTRNGLSNIVTINGGENVSNPYDGFGVGLVFKGRDYSNALRDYAYIYGAIEDQTSSTTPAGDPGFESQLRFYTNTGGLSATLPTQKMVITSAGKVGIGTPTPAVKLQVYGEAMPETTDAASVEEMLTLYRNGSATVWSGGATLALGRYSTGGGSAPKSRLDFKLKAATGSNTALPEVTVMTMQADTKVGIGTITPTARLDITNGEGKFCVDSKTHTLTNVFTTCLTVNLNSHTGCYVTLTCFGDWGGHSSAAYRGEFFLQNGANSYSEPGIILRQDDNTSNGADQIVCQILDPTGSGNPKDFEIQIRTTATAAPTSFTGQLTYTVQGKFNSVT